MKYLCTARNNIHDIFKMQITFSKIFYKFEIVVSLKGLNDERVDLAWSYLLLEYVLIRTT